MLPTDTAFRYDQIAEWWQIEHQNCLYGIAQLERAIKFTSNQHFAIDHFAIDIGCGSSGRLITTMLNHGFAAEGLDVSAAMINLAKQLHPSVTFYTADICEWIPPKLYSLIVAWDSTFHLPLDRQESVTRKLCDALEPGGILMFTCGGGFGQSEVAGEFQNLDFEYSTLGVNGFLKILDQQQCTCLHLEYDQHPENHVYVIAKKI